MTLGLARTFAPSFGKVEKKVQPDGSVETVKLSGLKGISHAGLTSKCSTLYYISYWSTLSYEGFGIIFESSENAAKHLASRLADQSIGVVKYK